MIRRHCIGGDGGGEVECMDGWTSRPDVRALRLKPAFHDTDTDILADSPETAIHPREDSRGEEIARVGRKDVGVSGESVSMSVSWNADLTDRDSDSNTNDSSRPANECSAAAAASKFRSLGAAFTVPASASTQHHWTTVDGWSLL